jgi:hypothetical protein
MVLEHPQRVLCFVFTFFIFSQCFVPTLLQVKQPHRKFKKKKKAAILFFKIFFFQQKLINYIKHMKNISQFV